MNPYLISALTLSPRVFEKLVEMIDPSDLDKPTHPGRFTPREVIAHLSDWEPILLQRMRKTLSDPGSELKVYDEGQRAIDNDYAKSSADEQLKLWSERRNDTVVFLSELSASDWDKSAVHPERGVLTIRDQANMVPGHDMYHVEQLIWVVNP